MQNFEFYSPTRVIFGNDILKDIGKTASEFGSKALLVYGQNSIKKSGLYDQIKKLLLDAGLSVTDFSGVKPNPELPHALKGAKKAVETGAEMIIAVGGGSVIDESKAIASGACYSGNLWDFYNSTASIKKVLPIIAVQTLPATSSETNMVSVITNPETNEKFAAKSPLIVPKVAYLDPSITFTIPLEYTAYASFDIMSHLLEGYFTSTDPYAPVQEGFVEGLVKAVMSSYKIVQKNSSDRNARSALMWAGAIAWNGLCNAGVEGASTPNHMLEHPLSAVYNVSHGAGLSIIFPAWLKHNKDSISSRILLFGDKILDMSNEIKDLPETEACDIIIERFSNWIADAGCPLSLREAGIENPDIPLLVKQARRLCGLWGIDGYTDEDLEAVYRLAL
jgi:alcohol dehydrogenase